MSAISGAAAALPRRIAAFAVDYVFIAAYLLVVVGAGALLRLVATGLAANLFADPLRAELIGFLTLTVPVSLYFVIGEASPAGATWGKRRMGLRVVTSRGARLTLGRSVLRTSLKFVPWELTHALI
jgi:RDD family.